MRLEALGVAALLLLSGCIAASGNTESAENLASTATDRSEERLQAGALVAAWAVEPPRHVEGDGNRLDIYLDDEPGDGDAPGWAFAYVNATEGGIVVVGDAVGVIAEFWHTFEGDEAEEVREEAPAIEGWTVDSREAAQILADDDRWPEIGDSWGVAWQLKQGERGPIWHVEASNVTFEGGGEEVEAVVSASNGTILGIERVRERPVPGGVEGPDASGGCVVADADGRVTTVTDIEAEFELPHDGRLRLQVDYGGAGPLDLRLLEDGEDEVWSETVTAAGGGTIDAHLQGLEAEDYVVEASTPAGVIDVSIHAIAAWGSGCSEEQAPPQGPMTGLRPAVSYVPSDASLGLTLLDGFLP